MIREEELLETLRACVGDSMQESMEKKSLDRADMQEVSEERYSDMQRGDTL